MKRLRGMDAMLLYLEAPNVATHTVKVGLLDVSRFHGELSFEVFRELLRRRLYLLDPLRYQLVNVPLRLHHPMWIENSEVDLDYHLRRVRVSSPGGRRELDQLTGDIAGKLLDRRRPLWEMYVVEGMADGSVPVILKIHHALADGVASGNLLARIMGFTATAAEEREPPPPDPVPSAAELLAAAGRDHLKAILRLPLLLGQTIWGTWRLRRAEKQREPHPELAGRFSPAHTFINHPLSAERRFASATFALADFKQTGKQLGITINDAVLATAAGALRELLLHYDGRADSPLIVSVPASLNITPGRIEGNEVGALNVSLPVQVDDVLERVRLTALGAAIAKEDFNLMGPRLISSWQEYMPPALMPIVFGWLATRKKQSKLQNLTISNVPGPRERGEVGGAMLREFYSVGPLLTGSALNITVWSYVDQLNFSVLTDDKTFGDAHEVTDALSHAFVEIRSAAGLSPTLTEVDTAMGAAQAIA
ncbi:wax ester/triacylglycerol synthase family O-acyltransferase [[Mycobacterium] vasticus]|uniref:Diacylglycerol O-acyltransferase n=1 Tax=[Mycobacterium] vasticus TaxID=2875777 RepID=A0ABU5YZH5_9MYCO|nr:wax ester/triacylglycerol synthase family O-acyltransferase [Mycolicibacter sp. MYC017]MEB3070540.1 wax ester/triacylglycerol synthase family O-acyltransferase [Mycolicibacter sp. MYC017]